VLPNNKIAHRCASFIVSLVVLVSLSSPQKALARHGHRPVYSSIQHTMGLDALSRDLTIVGASFNAGTFDGHLHYDMTIVSQAPQAQINIEESLANVPFVGNVSDFRTPPNCSHVATPSLTGETNSPTVQLDYCGGSAPEHVVIGNFAIRGNLYNFYTSSTQEHSEDQLVTLMGGIARAIAHHDPIMPAASLGTAKGPSALSTDPPASNSH
jgi:hypothetical protein